MHVVHFVRARAKRASHDSSLSLSLNFSSAFHVDAKRSASTLPGGRGRRHASTREQAHEARGGGLRGRGKGVTRERELQMVSPPSTVLVFFAARSRAFLCLVSRASLSERAFDIHCCSYRREKATKERSQRVKRELQLRNARCETPLAHSSCRCSQHPSTN